MNIEDIFNNYTNALEAIHNYFGYVEDWVVIPLDLGTVNSRWYFDENENGSGTVYFFDDNDVVYSHEIYTQRFLPKWVYRKEDYTMICCDTQVDGNKLLSVFDNKLEITEDQLTEEMKDDMF